MAGVFQVSVVTPEREVLALEAKFAAFPAYDGEMGVLAHRAPFLARLGAGILRVEAASGAERRLFVSGGFAQMLDERLTILTEEALEPAAVAKPMAAAARSAAEALPGRSEAEFERRQRALGRARALARSAS